LLVAEVHKSYKEAKNEWSSRNIVDSGGRIRSFMDTWPVIRKYGWLGDSPVAGSSGDSDHLQLADRKTRGLGL
jgi:hypothetical protein